MISDSYLVRSIKESTGAGRIIWWKNETGPYVSVLNEGSDNQIRIEISRVSSPSSGPLVCLKLSSARLRRAGKPFTVDATEPMTKPFRRKYEIEDERELAILFRELYSTVVNQCARREGEGQKNEDQVRQEIYRQILGFQD